MGPQGIGARVLLEKEPVEPCVFGAGQHFPRSPVRCVSWQLLKSYLLYFPGLCFLRHFPFMICQRSLPHEDVEQLEASYIADRAGTLQKTLAAPQKLDIELPYDPAISLLGIYARELKACPQKTCM